MDVFRQRLEEVGGVMSEMVKECVVTLVHSLITVVVVDVIISVLAAIGGHYGRAWM